MAPSASHCTAWRVVLVLALVQDRCYSGLPEVIRLGALIAKGEEDQELPFRLAVDRWNRAGLLPHSRLSAMVFRVNVANTFQCYKAVCSGTEKGAVAWFGPGGEALAVEALIGSLSQSLGIPHMAGRKDIPGGLDTATISLYPHQDSLSRAYRDFINHQGWKTVTILFWDPDGLVRVRRILEGSLKERGLESITLHAVTPGDDMKKLLKKIGRGKAESNFILDLPLGLIPDLMKEAHRNNLTTEYNNYLITSLDFHTVAARIDFQDIRANISAFRMVDDDVVTREWSLGAVAGLPVLLKTRAAVLMDSVTLFATTLRDLALSGQVVLPQRLTCHRHTAPWSNGSLFLNTMKFTEFKGVTGYVQLDQNGQRTNFMLDLLQIKSTGLVKVGKWSPDNGLKMAKNYTTTFTREIIQSLSGRHLRVITKQTPPYSMWDNSTGQFIGFGPDLVKKIAEVLNFTFEFVAVPDNAYGQKDARGRWDGMIGELVRREADMAVADLTITLEREEAVDFTMPFMNLGISILYIRPVKKPPKLFSFMKPFSPEVWLYMATAYLGITLSLYFLAMVSPVEWVNPHPCDPDPTVLGNTFHLPNSLWFTIGSLMQQGSDLAPRALSTRIMSSIWWFFTLIMISSYTANLAAVLTSERMKSPIEKVEDLVSQNTIQYGCVESGSTRAFFRNSKTAIYKRINAVMTAKPSVFTSSNQQGVDRVRKGNYAFFMESTSIEYITSTECDLMQINGLLDSKGYGIATPKGSPYTSLLSQVILDLQENGTLHLLKKEWWKKSPECEDLVSRPKGQASKLGIDNVGGVFVVLGMGVAVGFTILLLEYVWKVKKIPRDQRDSIPMEFLKDLRDTIFHGRGSTRPVPRYLSSDYLSNDLGLDPSSSQSTASYGAT